MKLTLYHYAHCPFCVRVRMALGYLNLPYESKIVAYDDEKTPVELTGKKMLPILLIDGRPMNESLDIVAAVDKENLLKTSSVINSPEFGSFNSLLNGLGETVHNLAMPYWVYTPEFNETSRRYFQEKKEVKRGPFKELVKNKDVYIKQMSKELELLSEDLKPFYRSEKFSLYDIMLSSHLWGLYVVPEFQFSEQLHSYLQSIKSICRFDYQQDMWK